jgi:hypothetical protein
VDYRFTLVLNREITAEKTKVLEEGRVRGRSLRV